MLLNTKGLNCWIELSEKAYSHNLHLVRKLIGNKVTLSVVVKANAYGHGWLHIANMAVKNGVNSFCVHSLEEALELRKAGFYQDVLIMGYIPLILLKEAVKQNLQIVIYNKESLSELIDVTQNLKQAARIHLKLETGFHRQGINEEDMHWFIDKLQRNQAIKIEAVYTHFANIDDANNHDYASYQLNRFKKMLNILTTAGFTNLKIHTACSAAIMLYPETHFDMVRLGISQYGLWSSKETFSAYKLQNIQGGDLIHPVLTWKTRVCQIKRVPAEHYIGYGCTYKTTRDTRIAILPIGYADGYDRGLSNSGYVLIRGKRAPILGRVCMNITIVDVTEITNVQLEDEVVLLGEQLDESISADTLADLIGTINYEIVTRINWNIPRFIVE